MEEDETPMATVLSGGTRSTHQQHQQQQQQQQQAVDGGGQGRRERRANRQAAHLHQREREFTGKILLPSLGKKVGQSGQKNRPVEEKLTIVTIIFYHLSLKHLHCDGFTSYFVGT